MTSSVESPFLKKYEGKIKIVNRESVIPKNEPPRRIGRQTLVADKHNHYSNQQPSNSGGTIQVLSGYLDTATDNLPSLPPLRTQPSIFNDEPSLEQLRKIAAERQYKDFNSGLSSSTPHTPAPASNFPTNYHPSTNYHSSNYYPSSSTSNTQHASTRHASPARSTLSFSLSSPSTDDPSLLQSRGVNSANAKIPSPSYPVGWGGNAVNAKPASHRLSHGPSDSYEHSMTPLQTPSLFPVTSLPLPDGYDPNSPSPFYYNSNPQSYSASYYNPSVYPQIPASHSKLQPSPRLSTNSNSLPSTHTYHDNAVQGNNASTKEQLYFSKQPREVYFKPHNIIDYRRLKDELSSVKMGKLGPDLQNTEYLSKLEQKAKMKEYSKNVRNFHNASGLPSGPGKLPTSTSAPSFLAEKRTAKEKRNKAIQYASQIPKPRPREANPQPATDGDGGDGDSDDLDEDEDEMMLREMELKHKMARDNIVQIRKEFGLT